MEAFAAIQRDPLVRSAIELIAFEERRHQEVLESMTAFYGIPLSVDRSWTPPPNPEWTFLCSGYGECFDAFFSFGLFRLARESEFFPAALVDVFEPIIQEEARHILFFANWAAYTQANRPLLLRPSFAWRRARALISRVRRRLRFTKRGQYGANIQEAPSVAVPQIGPEARPRRRSAPKLTISSMLSTCMAEDDWRMARYDSRLVRPRAVRHAVSAALPLLRLLGK